MEPVPRAILFDWGGTLARVATQDATREPCVQAALHALKAQAIPVPEAAAVELLERFRAACDHHEALHETEELATGHLLRDWSQAHDLSVAPDTLAALTETFWQPWIGCLEVIPGVPTLLAELRRAGYCLGLVSNCAAVPSVCHAELRRQGLAEHLDFAVFSSETGKRKPHPAIYERALSELCQRCNDLEPAAVLFVGDTPLADVEGPARHAMRTALVRAEKQNHTHSTQTCEPLWTLDRVHDLPEVLARYAAPSSPSHRQVK